MNQTAPASHENRLRPIRSFVLRAGRLTRAQRRALDELWPAYGIDHPGEGPIDLASAFGRQAPTWLEIGFGNGEALLAMAEAHPDVNLLGIEVHRPGVGHLLNGLRTRGLDNVRVVCGDAAEVVRDRIRAGALARALIFFPDPWPKKRHHKRRLVQPAFVEALAHTLAPGGLLHLATDWEEYALHMRAVLDVTPAFANTAAPWAERPAYRPQTRFETRGEGKGHVVRDLVYERR